MNLLGSSIFPFLQIVFQIFLNKLSRPFLPQDNCSFLTCLHRTFQTLGLLLSAHPCRPSVILISIGPPAHHHFNYLSPPCISCFLREECCLIKKGNASTLALCFPSYFLMIIITHQNQKSQHRPHIEKCSQNFDQDPGIT